MDNLTLTSKQRWIKKQVGDDWEDIVQEAKMNCLKQSNQPYYDAYLSRAITNAAINLLKHRKAVEMVSLNEREDKCFNLGEHSYEIDFGVIHDLRQFMLPRWTAQERDVIFMFFTDQITVRIAADLLRKSRSRVHVWLRDVERQFREGLRDYVN